MITSLANSTQELIIRRSALEQIQDNKRDVADTHQSVTAVGARLRQAVASFGTIKPCLTSEQVIEATTRLQNLGHKLRASHEKFPTQYRQVKELDALGRMIEELDTFLARAWASFVLAETQPHFELLELVATLPEVSGQIGTVRPLRDRLQSASSRLPRNQSNRAQFESDLLALQNSLANLSGLDRDVTEFLRKVQKGTASMSDLTDEILDWCRENERATAFKISFRQIR
jgi:hypothetical protein